MSYSLLLLAICLAVVSAKHHKGGRTVFGTRHEENIPTDWEKSEPADKDLVMPFIVALEQRNLDTLEELFWEVSDPQSQKYRQFMEIEDINEMIAPKKGHVKKIVKHLKENGVIDIENRGDSLYCHITVEAAEKLFETTFHTFIHESGTALVRQFGSFSLPKKVAKHVDFVAGFSEFPTPRFSAKKTPNPEASVSVSPQSIQTIYKLGNAAVHSNSSASAVEFERQSYSPTDLANFARQFKVPINPLSSSHVVGPNDPGSPGIEATLDIEYILGVAPGVTGWFWLEGSNVWLYGFANHLFNYRQAPLVNSISYGWNEEAQCLNGIGGAECDKLGVNSKQYVQRVNTEFQKIGLRGITLICASGDSGANGRTDSYCSENHLNPVFPAASPYITSVGATQISSSSGRANLPSPPPGCEGRSCASAGTEECVSFEQSHFTSGGGFSDVAATPAFQQAAVQKYLNSGVALPPSSYFNRNGRGFPDVSAFGSNILILTRGIIEGVGGTSASAPIFGGLVSLLNDYAIARDGKPLGFVSPLLYQMAANTPSTFTDVTVGDNKCTEGGCHSNCKGFEAAAGWDPISGLGTPVYSEMLTYIRKNLK